VVGKSKSDDRELQIELAKAQLAAQFYMTAAFGLVAIVISVLALFETLYFTLPSDQAAVKGGLPYLMIVLIATIIPAIGFFLHKTDRVQEGIEGLKERFLLKQTETSTTESEQPSKTKSQRGSWRKWFKKTENKALVVLIIGLCITSGFTALNTYHEWNPPASPAPRAKLTIYIFYPQFNPVANSTATDVTVNTLVVNDSPMSATITQWNLTLNYNMTYQILNQVATSGNLTLSPSAQTSFTITTTLEGQNNTLLPNTDIRSIIFAVSYQDNIGLQDATRTYPFL
jgi:hypothetical protein